MKTQQNKQNQFFHTYAFQKQEEDITLLIIF
jgi:hypothetical protein